MHDVQVEGFWNGKLITKTGAELKRYVGRWVQSTTAFQRHIALTVMLVEAAKERRNLWVSIYVADRYISSHEVS